MRLCSNRTLSKILALLTLIAAVTGAALAQKPDKCGELPDYNKLKNTLITVVKQGKEANSGLGNPEDRKSTRLNSSHANISYAVFCLKKKNMPLDARASPSRPSATKSDCGFPTPSPTPSSHPSRSSASRPATPCPRMLRHNKNRAPVL